jgi:hypothetical protein
MNYERKRETEAYIQNIIDTGVVPKSYLAVDANKDGVITEQEVLDLYG